MIRVGLKNAVVAQLTKDIGAQESENGRAEVTYGQVTVLPNSQQVDLTMSVQSVNVDSDDVTDVIDVCTGCSGTLTRNSFTPEEASMLLGEKKIDGINVSTGTDEAPYFAFGFKSLLKGENAGGKYLYMWVLKTKFSLSSMTAQSMGNESLTPQPDALTFKSSGRSADGAWRFHMMSNDPNADSTFFSAETLQKLANAATQVFSSPVQAVSFVETLPETGEVGTIYIAGGTAAHYWDGAKFDAAPAGE